MLESRQTCGGQRVSIEYLIIGHITEDLTATGTVPGGTALYAATTAQRLGRRVALVTRAPAGMDVAAAMPGIEVALLPTERATTFENRYRGNDREQILHHAAAPLIWDEIPPAWRQAPIVHLAPIAQDVDRTLLAAFPNALVCVTPQGWLRGWDEAGRVRYAPLTNTRSLLRPVDVMVFSAEDVAHDPLAMRDLIGSVPIAVVTRAAEGAVVYTKDGPRPTPARPARVVDPTGAGDVFAAAFFSTLYERGDPYEAAAFANVVASFSIEAQGTAGIPTRAQVEAWFAQQQR